VLIAEGFGCKALRVDTSATLGDALVEAWKAEGPVLIDVPVDQAVHKLY
jgi:thiamine pyrophosphate-dependent acetolactate synthase large subunit-like protein